MKKIVLVAVCLALLFQSIPVCSVQAIEKMALTQSEVITLTDMDTGEMDEIKASGGEVPPVWVILTIFGALLVLVAHESHI